MLDVPTERPLEGETLQNAPKAESIYADIPSFRYESSNKEILQDVHSQQTPVKK